MRPTRAHQRASAGLCCVLGLSLVLPYAYPCARHCVAPMRPTGHWGYPCEPSVGHRGALCLAYFVRPLRACLVPA
nr:MAG TPA: hypothetical protein [Caudoviricetes sp.]